jgi:hypothetical protein
MQVLGPGNAINLLDGVGNFPEDWNQGARSHEARGRVKSGLRTGHAAQVSHKNPAIDRVPFLN